MVYDEARFIMLVGSKRRARGAASPAVVVVASGTVTHDTFCLSCGIHYLWLSYMSVGCASYVRTLLCVVCFVFRARYAVGDG